jgi:hypothetical protein
VPVYVLVVGGIGYALLRPAAGDVMMLAVFVPYYVYIANEFPAAAHYTVPLVPFAVIMAARFAAVLLKNIRWRAAGVAVLGLIALTGLGNAVYYDLLVQTCHRNHLEAGAWINSHLPDGVTIGTTAYPYFGYRGYPPFALLRYRINEVDSPEYYIVVNDDDPLLRSAEFAHDYRQLRSFSGDHAGILGTWYRNNLYHMWDQNIRIYAKNGRSAGKGGQS